MKLSNQAIGAVMMALQKSLMDQSDIVPVLQGFNLVSSEDVEGEVIVLNPPIVKFDTGGALILNDGDDGEEE